MRRQDLLAAWERYQRQTERFLSLLTGQEGVSYRVTGISPDDVEFTSSDWDGSEAEASAPNPSESEDAPGQLDAMYLLLPEGDEARDAKANWKLPVREGPDGPVNTNALTAAIAAINGARGGVEGVSQSALESAYEKAVDLAVEAGVYDEPEDAPDFEGSAADARAQDGFEPARTTDDGLPLFPSRDAAEQAAEFAGGCSGAHQMEMDGETFWMPCSEHDAAVEVFGSAPDPELEGDAADAGGDVFEVDLTAEATGSVTAGIDPDADAVLEAAAGDGLVGIIWGAGNHDLSLGGEPTPVHVPEDTIPDTFQALREDVESGEVTVGLDHADGDAPVLADTGLIEIAVARDVALAADERHIVLTESEFKNEQAAEAHANGEFDGFDFSVVADVAVRTDDDGDRVTTDDGRVVLDAVRVKRIDAVETGAVEAASIGTIPELAEQVSAAADANDYATVANALHATATDIEEHMKDLPDDGSFETDPEDLDAAKAELSTAAEVVETLQARAEAFEQVAAAHDVDPDEQDDVEAAVQAIVDDMTADIRAEIAEYEAALASYDTDEDSIDDRAAELTGRSVAELKARRGDLAHELNQVRAREAKKGAGVSKDDKDGHLTGLTGGSSGGDDSGADDLALEAMGARDKLEVDDTDMTPAEFIRARYDVDPSEFDRPGELNAAIYEAKAGDSA